MKLSKYLLVGNSASALYCLETLREVDPEGEIIIVSDEEHLNYSRPLLSYYLGGRIEEKELSFRDKEFYKRNKVNLILGKKAEKLLWEKKEITLEDGSSLSYDKLLIATGGKPIVPKIEGLDRNQEGVFTFTRLKEARNLVKYIEKNEIKEALVLGGGLIGLKATEGLLERGIKVTVVELADRILASTFDREASAIVENRLKEKGCQVIKEDTIQEVRGEKGRIKGVKLKGGGEIQTNLLLLAIGVRPNLDLVKDTPIKTDKGILVDRFMRTSIKNIYSAGDCAQGYDFLNKSNSVLALWPVAARQGKVAGLNMGGRKTEYQGLFLMNSVQILDIPTISFGITDPPNTENYEILQRKEEGGKFYKKVVLKDKKIVGVILLNVIERAGIYGMLIKEEVDVSGFQEELLKDDFGFLILPREFRKHLVVGEGIEV